MVHIGYEKAPLVIQRSGNIMQALLTMLLSERFTESSTNGDGQPRSDVAEKLREEIRRSMSGKKE